LQPDAAALISDVSPIFKLHLFLGMTIFVAFPFTRLVHMWSAPVWYLGRTGYQVVRTKRGMARRPTQVAAAAIGRGRQPVGGCARPNPAVGTANGATRSSPFRDAASGRGGPGVEQDTVRCARASGGRQPPCLSRTPPV
jgi:Nitrate reductase gamma subunit